MRLQPPDKRSFSLKLRIGSAVSITAGILVLTAQVSRTVTVGDRSFEDFVQGDFGNSGANLFVSKTGHLETINRWDFNNDGQIDLLINNKHDYNWAPDALIYWGNPDGFRSLTPTGWQKYPLFDLLRYFEQGRNYITRLPAFGGGRSRVLDLNGDGYLDLIFINFLHAEKTDQDAYIYWGGPTGFDAHRVTKIPTKLATGLAAADLNGDGYMDLVFSNFGVELGEVFGFKDNLESWIYWGSSTGYDVRRRTSLPTISSVDCAAADINGDGHIDLVFLNNNSKVKHAYIYWGNSHEFSAAHRTTLQVDDPKGLTAADINGDGKADLIITGAGQSTNIFFGATEGIEQRPRFTLPSNAANAALVADLNRDGKLDIVLANTNGNVSFIYWGSSQGFSPANRAELPTLQAWGVAAGDLNDDGWPDLVFANSSDGKSSDVNSYVYWGSPSGYASNYRSELQTFGAVSVQIADFNRDGRYDVAFVNQSSGKSDEAIDSYIYWGNPQHFYSESSMSRLPTISADKSSSADLNGDGYPDIVITNTQKDAPIYLYWGGPDGYSPARRSQIPLPDAYGTSVADLNRDGYLDLLVSVGPRGVAGMGLAAQGLVKDHGYATILWGGPTGYSIQNRQDLAIRPRFPFSNAIADFNKDGYLDLAFPDRNGDQVQIVWGRKSGYDVKNSTYLPTNSSPSLEVADVNGDGWLDLISPNGQDWKTQTRHTRSYIYLGGPDGFSPTRRFEVESVSAHEAAVADFNLDGYLDIAFSSYQGDENRNVPTFIYWGGPDGKFSDARRTMLPSHGGCGVLAGDLNQDGYPDLFVWNHMKDGDHSVSSWIYWGGKEGFSVTRRSGVPTAGPHYSMGVDIGNLYDRKPEEYYTSRAHHIPDGVHPVKLKWDAVTTPGTGVKLQMRTAGTREALQTAPWQGPQGANSFYEKSGQKIRSVPTDHHWAQYRITFTGLGVGNSSVVKSVEMESAI